MILAEKDGKPAKLPVVMQIITLNTTIAEPIFKSATSLQEAAKKLGIVQPENTPTVF